MLGLFFLDTMYTIQCLLGCGTLMQNKTVECGLVSLQAWFSARIHKLSATDIDGRAIER